MNKVLLTTSPCHIFAIKVSSDYKPFSEENGQVEGMLFLNHLDCEFRSVSFDRLDCVLRNGIDVDPPESPIFVASPDKALEYGDMPKIILVLRKDYLDPSYRELELNTPKHIIDGLQRIFPTKIKSLDGEKIHLSKFREDDPRVASYELEWGYWIPRDHWKALSSIYLLFRPEDEPFFLEVQTRVANQ